MSKEKILVTAGLPYSNGDTHVGHIAGCYLPADIFNRYQKLKGKDSKYICGSDDHGVAIVLSSQKQGKTPQEIVSYYHERQKEAFKSIDIEFDVYGSTSMSEYHKELSEDFFKGIHEKGYLTKKSFQQFYDEDKKMFLPDRYVKGECSYCGAEDQNGDQCENCGKILDTDHLKNPRSVLSDGKVSLKETIHWFLDLSQAQKLVEDWVATADMKENTRSYVKSLIASGLVERCMTRDIDWGIPVPLDDPDAKNKVMYVWFDAPVGYISNTKEMFIKSGLPEDEYKKWWSGNNADIYHFVGEDNTIFHCIIWIAMLGIHGKYQLPKGVIVNNFMNIKLDNEVQKLSKSKGNAIGVLDYMEKCGEKDYLRYYLTTIAPEKARANFSREEFLALTNSDLADTLGNLINRSISFSFKFIGEQLPDYNQDKKGKLEAELLSFLDKTVRDTGEFLENYSTKNAQKTIFDFARECNKYFNDKAPWSTRKTDMEETMVTLGVTIQVIYSLGVLLQPFMPEKAASILSIFGIDSVVPWEKATDFPPPGSHLNKPDILFKKLEEISF